MNLESHKDFRKAIEIIQHIEKSGGEAYIVGGAVRDFLAERKVGDIDIATSLLPERIIEIFDKVIPIGLEHGTVLVRYETASFEVTTYRTESGYQDFRHPDEVRFVNQIEEDLARRDFTMNAIAMDQQGEIIDPYGGADSLKNRRIQSVGDPALRFQEDPLRIMRALRFASQLEFSIEDQTIKAIQTYSHLLSHIAVERLAAEFEKMYQGPGYKTGINLCVKTEVVNYLPIFKEHPSALSFIPKSSLLNFSEVIAFYQFKVSHWTIKDWKRAWKLSNLTRNRTEILLSSLKEYKTSHKVTGWLVYNLDKSLYPSFARVLASLGLEELTVKDKLEEQDSQLPIHSEKDLEFGAKDLIELKSDLQKGPWIKAGITQIEYLVVNKQLTNQYSKIKEWAAQWNPPANN